MATPLISPQWLAKQIEKRDPELRIFDTTITINGLGDEDFKSAHIDGAQFLNLFKDTKPTKYLPVNLPEPAVFQDYARSLGINTSSHVILYENTDLHGFAAPRAWWMLRAYGIRNVSVLDGGLKRWRSEGYPVTVETTEHPKGDVAVTTDASRMMSFSDIVASADIQLVDSRPPDNFAGEHQEPSPFLQAFMPALGMKKEDLDLQTGHIPGAASVPYPSMYQEDGVTFKTKEDLTALFQKQGVNMKQPITAYCYVGLTACIFALAASVCGHGDVSVYYGSWVDYGQRAPQSKVQRSCFSSVP
ncbi:thiosulfate sulfurtransferase-like [Haliotis rubra]|uniref:thiosulfate sulfurtransferase-like n=1 Tax=Haliotis rubra TaxID=36100 RepID=UPI001EE53614|nr:thiosulfate sulfurtransferase-like [Haliotis rubra]